MDGELLPEGGRRVPLTQGQFAVVDTADYDRVMQFKWCASRSRNTYYAVYWPRGVQRPIAMHTFLTGYAITDHINGDGLDNRRSNMRKASRQQNAANVGPRANNTSGYKGVTWRKDRKKWQAAIAADNKDRYLGVFASAEEAARAYDKAAIELHGEFAWLNFPGGELDGEAA